MSVIVPLEGVDAKLSIANHAATEQRRKAAKMRGLKKAACESVFFRITVFGVVVRPLDRCPGGAADRDDNFRLIYLQGSMVLTTF